MIDYELALCYGVIIPADKMEEIKEALTDEEYGEIEDIYCRCVNSWTAENYFIGIIYELDTTGFDYVYRISVLSSLFAKNINEDLIDFTQFCNGTDLWRFIDWKPELMLINFCY